MAKLIYINLFAALIIMVSTINCFKVNEEYHSNSYLEDTDDYITDSIFSSIKKWHTLRQLKHRLKQRFERSFPFRNRHRMSRSKEVCFENVGCFKDDNPFDHFTALPASPEKISTSFTLYTRNNPKFGENLDYLNGTTLRSTQFSPKKRVIIIIHGFGSNGKKPWVLQMTEALLHTADFNVIVVDWRKGCAPPNYVQAAANTRVVSKQISILINTINREMELTGKDYHLIGFSLGAHIAGFTGAEIGNISRITGLDPASPLFEHYSEKVRLDPSDADFVDVIHTNGEEIHRGGVGSMIPMGHLDFYPNGGRKQPGCNSFVVGAIKYILNGKNQDHNLCHHRRAPRLFIESMTINCKLKAFSCESYQKFLRGQCFRCGEYGEKCAFMGFFASKPKIKRNMYLLTREKEPFCGNPYKLEIESQASQGSTWGKLEIDLNSDTTSEPFQLTSEKDEIQDTSLMQGLIMAQSYLKNVTHVIIKYTKYRGWIYSGKSSWNIQRITLTNNYDESVSFCGLKTLKDNTSLRIDLIPGNCTTQTTILST